MAHPGDEVIAAGGTFHEWIEAGFIHLTEGSPRNLDHAFQAGFECLDEYARAGQHEFEAALHSAGLRENQVRNLGYAGGSLSNHLASVTLDLTAALRETNVQMVITQPYEGAHPDYDAAAFAVQAACQLLEQEGAAVPSRIEVAGFHEQDGGIFIGQFLTPLSAESITIRLDATRQQFKRAALNCLATQSALLENAEIHSESFRVAPIYDFTSSPREGVLEYENRGLGNGRRWRRLAGEALRVLGLG
jgi:LmbE family N-acetylglucosaminyl deacetylase